MQLAPMPLVSTAHPHARLRAWGLSPRDASILASTLAKLDGAPFDFHDAARAMHESVIERIPAGRCYLLGAGERGPILGSIISGVGITADAHGVLVVRVTPDGRTAALGSLQQ